jgi:excisionase family DNA binding protein
MTLQVYTAAQAAELLGCAQGTVEDMARDGRLPGIKPGGTWVFPAGALALRLDELALEEAAARRKPLPPSASTRPPAPSARRGPKPRPLPRLVDVGEGG